LARGGVAAFDVLARGGEGEALAGFFARGVVGFLVEEAGGDFELAPMPKSLSGKSDLPA
jgi:hypothetical protein